MAPKYSIITVTLDNCQGLQETYKSICAQTCDEFEWVVVDGGSDDGTTVWLKELDFSGLNWSSKPDQGLYDAMDTGIDRARGHYLIFLNAGDRFADDQVLNQVQKIGQGDILYGDALEFDGRDYLLKRAFSHFQVWYSMFTHHQAIFYKRSSVGDLRYGIDLKIAADWAFTAQLYLRGCQFQRLGFPVCIFARGGVSQSRSGDVVRRIRRERLWIYHHIFQMPLWRAQTILIAKQSSEWFRATFPKTYDRLRFSQSQS